MKAKLLILFWVLLIAPSIYSQSIGLFTVSSAGENFKNDTGQLTWNLGETCITAHEGQNVILSEGFCQAFDFLSFLNPSTSPIKTSIYPNPFTSYINIETDFGIASNCKFTISDLYGKLVQKGVLSNSTKHNRINLDQLERGSYFITFYSNSEVVNSQTIIKIQK